MNDLIKRQKAIDLAHELIVPNEYKYGLYNQAINNYCAEIMQLPSAQPEIEEKLYQYKCYITDNEGLQHEVIHIDDIRRVTGWMI